MLSKFKTVYNGNQKEIVDDQGSDGDRTTQKTSEVLPTIPTLSYNINLNNHNI